MTPSLLFRRFARQLRPAAGLGLAVAAASADVGVPGALPAALDPVAEEVLQLAPLLVEEKLTRGPASEAGEAFNPQQATGNLDLPRTEDDVLPFTIFDRQQIYRSGAVNLEEFMRREMLDSAAGSPGTARAGVAGSAGLVASGTNLQLRGYAADETVVLVNGRRLPETVMGGANSQPLSPDVNLIPLSLVERIEVLPVSASALYSGNPVGGVVNVVLRSNVEVSEIATNYSNATGGFDAAQSSVSVLHGRSLAGGKLRLRLNATLTATTPPTESELGHIAANLRAHPSRAASLYRATPNIRSSDGGPLFPAGEASRTSVPPGADGLGGRGMFVGREGLASLALFDLPSGLAYSPNSVDFPYGQTQRTQSLFGSAVYDVSPWLELGFDGMFSRTVTHRGYDVFPVDLRLQRGSPLNPFDRSIVISLTEIAPDLGADYGEARREFSSAVIGAMLRLPADWRVSLDTQLSRSLTEMRGVAGVDYGRWQQLVERGLYHPLRDTQLFGPPPQFYEEVLIYAGRRGQFVRVGDYRTLDTALRITNRHLRFPTGTAAVNVGGDFRVTELSSYDDEQRFGDGGYAAPPVHWKGRTLQRLSTFGELQAPLLPAAWLPVALTRIEGDLAARYTVADTTQETNLAPTGGLKVGLAGGWTLRASLATSNRLPTPFLNQKTARPAIRVNSASGVSYIPVFDPVRQESYGVRAGETLNPNLRPEAAMTRSAGVIYERGGRRRLRAAVDFVDTQKSGELMYLDPQSVLNLERLLPERVQRTAPAAGDPKPAGPVDQVLTGNFNVAWRHSQNVTSSVDYAWLGLAGGTLDVYGRWIHFLRYERQLLPDSAMVDELRMPDGTTSGLLRHRVNVGAGWSNQRFGLRLDGHYFDARTLPVVEWPSQGARSVDPYLQFDASFQKDLGRWVPWNTGRTGLQAQLRIDNLFNARPPAYLNDPSGAGVQSYGDWRGQTYSLSLRLVF